MLRQLGGENYAALLKRAIEWKHLIKSPQGYLSGKRSLAYMVNQGVLSVAGQQRYSLGTKAAIRVRREYQESRKASFAAKHAVYRKIAESIARLSFDYEAACRYVVSIADPEGRGHRQNIIEQVMLGEMVWATDQQGRNYTVLVSVPRDIRQFFSCGTEPLFVVDSQREFGESAREAVSEWRFSPVRTEGPSSSGQIECKFSFVCHDEK